MKLDSSPVSTRGGWLRGALVGAQVAVCMVLLISASLLLRALHVAYTVDPDFQYEDVAVVSVDLRGPGYRETAVDAFRAQLIERVGAIPGVTAVAQVGKVPLSPGRTQGTFRPSEHDKPYEFDVNAVSPEYFSLLGIPIVSGRAFSHAELELNARAVVVTEATARRLWGDGNPVGRTLVAPSNPSGVYRVVGVARDAHVSHLAGIESSFLYLPAGPSGQRQLSFLVKSGTKFESLAASIRAVLKDINPGLVPQVRPLEANLDLWRTSSRGAAVLAGSLSLLALVLAIVGVYSVVSFIVVRRRREVGIRLTLGATPSAVHWLILRETLRPVGLGVLGGVVAALFTSQMLEARLFGISPFDSIAFVAAALFLLTVAAAATMWATKAALRVDPASSLRCE